MADSDTPALLSAPRAAPRPAPRPEAGERRAIELVSPRVRWTRPGLGWLLARGAVGLFALAVLFMRLGGATDAPWPAWLTAFFETCSIVTFVLSPVLAVLSAVANRFSLPRPSWASLSAGEEGLSIARGRRARLVPKSRIAEGTLVPSTPKAQIELRLRGGGLITAEVEDEAEARKLLKALRLGAAERKATIALATSGQMILGGCLGAFVSLLVAVFLYVILSAFAGDRVAAAWMDIGAFFLIALGTIFGGYNSGGTKQIVIGADGVRVPGRTRARFIPYSKIAGVAILDGHLVLRLREGAEGAEGSSVMKVSVWVPSDSELEGATRRIREAMSASWARPLSAEGLAALEPRGRSVASWREALRALVRKGEAYRHAGPLEEDLLAVLADPNAPPPRRIGAALALRATEDPEAPAKILAAAGSCARDRLRVALEQAAGDELEEAALKEALAEAEQEEAAARVARQKQ
jgi:hypothetical protein